MLVGFVGLGEGLGLIRVWVLEFSFLYIFLGGLGFR